jgi:hypothetical protein
VNGKSSNGKSSTDERSAKPGYHAGQILSMSGDAGERLFGSRWPSTLRWAREQAGDAKPCQRCGMYCTDADECHMARDGVAAEAWFCQPGDDNYASAS